METEVSKQNIADIVEEETSHFRVSPFFSRVHKLQGINIGIYTDADDAEYSLNLGIVARATEFKKSVNIGILGGGGNIAHSSFNFGGLASGFDYIEKSCNIVGIAASVGYLKDSLNVSCFMADIDKSRKFLQYWYYCIIC